MGNRSAGSDVGNGFSNFLLEVELEVLIFTVLRFYVALTYIKGYEYDSDSKILIACSCFIFID